MQPPTSVCCFRVPPGRRVPYLKLLHDVARAHERIVLKRQHRRWSLCHISTRIYPSSEHEATTHIERPEVRAVLVEGLIVELDELF